MKPPEQKGKEDLVGLFDLAIPIGMPVSVIQELVETYELDLVKRTARVNVIGEVDEREILVLRGDLETIKKAERHMFKALDEKVGAWDRNERYKEIYEQGRSQRAVSQEGEAQDEASSHPESG